jgi:hypothetical protein
MVSKPDEGFVIDFDTSKGDWSGYHRAAAREAVKRKPLPREHILRLLDTTVDGTFIDFARAIEAAHGIKEGT